MRVNPPRGAGALALLLLLLLAAGARAQPLRVAVISDLNGSYGSVAYAQSVRRAVASIAARRPDLVLSTGDMVAGQRARPPLGEPELAAMWAAFHRSVTDPLAAAGAPLAVAPGNHDASAYPAFRAERSRYAREWTDRRPALTFIDAAHYPFYYSFALRGVLFVALDVTRTGPIDPDQRRWLAELLSQRGGGYRHRVAFGHLPVHPFARGRETEVSGDLELERLLADHDVDLYLSGHHHAFYPGYRGGLRHVGQACLGAGPRPLLGTDAPAPRAVTWLEFDGDGVRVLALTGADFDEPLDLASLPAAVGRGAGALVRDDLRPRRAVRR